MSVKDICEIHLQLLSNKKPGLFNAGTGETTSFQTVAEVIAKKYNAEIIYVAMPNKLKGQYQEYTCADNAKLHNAIAIRHWHTIEEYINGTN